MISIDTLNAWGRGWASYVTGSLIDAAAVLAVVGLVWLLARRWASPQFGSGLFLLVIVKLLVPLPVVLPAWAAYLSPRYAVDRFAGVRGGPEGHGMTDPELLPKFDEGVALGLARADSNSETTRAGKDSHAEAATALPARAMMLSTEARWMLGWAGVVLALLLRFGWVQWRTQRQLRHCLPIDPGSLPVDMAELRRLAGVGRAVPVLGCPAVGAPATWGLLKPRIILPPDLPGSVTAKQLQWILLHELAHIRRGDLWVATVQRLVQIVQCFNPAVWIANWMIDQQREYACDDVALATGTTSRRDCGRAFLSIVEHLHERPMPMASALGILPSKRYYRRRLMRILDTKRRAESKLSLGFAILLVAVAIAVLPRIQASEEAIDSSPLGTQAATAQAEPKTNPSSADKPSETPAPSSTDADSQEDTQRDLAAKFDAEGSRYNMNDEGQITFVHLGGPRITDEGLEVLKDLDYLEVLALSNTPNITGSGFKHLRGHQHLREIHLNGSKNFTDEGLSHLKDITSLTHLVLSETQISDDGLVHLTGLTNLRNLYLDRGPKISDSGLAQLTGLTSLRHLYLGQSPITDAGLERLTALKHLKSLSLSGTKISGEGLRHLRHFTELENLSLSYTDIGDDGLQYLQPLQNLKNLNLRGTKTTDAGLAHLNGLCRRLTKLNLADTSITDAGLDALNLGELTQLESLALAGLKITDATLERHVKGLTNLHTLGLGGTGVTDAGLAHLAELTKMWGLVLIKTKITGAGLAHLKTMQKLQDFKAGGTKIDDAGLEHLKGLKKLMWIWVDECTEITDAGLAHLRDLPDLLSLRFSDTQITDAGLLYLKDKSKLRWLRLNRTKVTDAGLIHLAGLSQLRGLNVDGTAVTPAGIESLQRVLPNLASRGL